MSCHSVAVVLTPVQTKQMRINVNQCVFHCVIFSSSLLISVCLSSTGRKPSAHVLSHRNRATNKSTDLLWTPRFHAAEWKTKAAELNGSKRSVNSVGFLLCVPAICCGHSEFTGGLQRLVKHSNELHVIISTTAINRFKGTLNGATLNRATLHGATLHGATLNGVTLNDTTLNGITFNCATFNCATFNGATLNGATLDTEFCFYIQLHVI